MPTTAIDGKNKKSKTIGKNGLWYRARGVRSIPNFCLPRARSARGTLQELYGEIDKPIISAATGRKSFPPPFVSDLRSLTWMVSQETGGVSFEEEEVSETRRFRRRRPGRRSYR